MNVGKKIKKFNNKKKMIFKKIRNYLRYLKKMI